MIDLKKIIQYYSMNDVPQEKISMCFRSIFFKFLLGFFCYYPMKIHAMNDSNKTKNNRKSNVEKIEEDPIQELAGEIEVDFDFCMLSNLFLQEDKISFNNKFDKLKKILEELNQHQGEHQNVELINYCNALVWFFDTKVEVGEKEIPKKEKNDRFFTSQLLTLLECIAKVGCNKKKSILLGNLAEKIKQENIAEDAVGFDTLIMYINDLLEENKDLEKKNLFEFTSHLFSKWADSVVATGGEFCSLEEIDDPYYQARESIEKMALCLVKSNKDIFSDNLGNVLNIFQANKNDLDRLLFFSLYELLVLREVPAENKEYLKQFIKQNRDSFLKKEFNQEKKKISFQAFFEKSRKDFAQCKEKIDEISDVLDKDKNVLLEVINTLKLKIEDNKTLSKQEYTRLAVKCDPDKLSKDNEELGRKLFAFVNKFYTEGQNYGQEKDFNVSIDYIKKMNPTPRKLILVVNELVSNNDELIKLQGLVKSDNDLSFDIKEFFDGIEFKENPNNGLKIGINTKKVQELETVIELFPGLKNEMVEKPSENRDLIVCENMKLNEGERFYNQYIDMFRIWNDPVEKLNYMKNEKLLCFNNTLAKYQRQIEELEAWEKNYKNFKHNEYIQRKMNLAQKLGLIIPEKSLGTKAANVAYSLLSLCGRVYQNWTDSVESFKAKHKADLYERFYREKYELEAHEEKQKENYNQTETININESMFELIDEWSQIIDKQIEEFQKEKFKEEDLLIKKANLIDTDMKKAYLKKKNKLEEENAKIKNALDEEYNKKWVDAQERLQGQENKKKAESDEYLKAIEKRDDFDKNIVWKNMHRVYERLDLLDKVKTKGVSAIPERIDELVEHFRKYFLEAKSIENFMVEGYFSDEYDHGCFLVTEKEEKKKYVVACKNIIPHFSKTNQKVLNDVVIFCLSYLEKVSKEFIRDRSGIKDLFIDLIVTYEDFLYEDTNKKCEKLINTVFPMTLFGVGARFGLDEGKAEYEEMAKKIGKLNSKDLSMKLFGMLKDAGIKQHKGSKYVSQLISWMRWYYLEYIALNREENKKDIEFIDKLYQILKARAGMFLVKDPFITNVWGTSGSLKSVLEYYTVMKNKDSSSKKVLDQLESILLVFFSDYDLFCMINEGGEEYNELKTGLKKNLRNKFLFYVDIVEKKKEDAKKVLDMYQGLSEHEENDLIHYLYCYLKTYEKNNQGEQYELVPKIIDYLEKNELIDLEEGLISKKAREKILEYMKRKKVELEEKYRLMGKSLVPVKRQEQKNNNMLAEMNAALENIEKKSENPQLASLSQDLKKLINAGESIPRDLYKHLHPDFKSFKIPLTEEEKKQFFIIIQNYNATLEEANKKSDRVFAIEYQSNENQLEEIKREITGIKREEIKPDKKIESRLQVVEEPLSKVQSGESEREEPDKKIESKLNVEEPSSEVSSIQIKSEPDSNEEPGSNSESKLKVKEPEREEREEIRESFEAKLVGAIKGKVKTDNASFIQFIDVCLQSLDKEDKNEFMQNEIKKLIPDMEEFIEKVDFCRDGNHLIKEILNHCYDTVMNFVLKQENISCKKEENFKNINVKDFVTNYNLFLDQKNKHTGYYSPTKFAFSIFTGIPAGAAMMLPYICQKSPQISAFVDSMLSKDFGSKVVQAVGNMRDVFSGMTVMSKPIGKQIASFIYSKRGYNTLGAIGLCVLLYSLHKIISEWHLRGENKILDNLTLENNQSIQKLTGQCQKIFGSTLTISKISAESKEQIFCYRYEEEKESKEKLLLDSSNEREGNKKVNDLYSDLENNLKNITSLWELFDKKNELSIGVIINTAYAPVLSNHYERITPGNKEIITTKGGEKDRGASFDEKLRCRELFKNKVCELAIEDWEKDITKGTIQSCIELENIFDATYIVDGGSCYFNSEHAIESLRGFVTGRIQDCLNEYTSGKAEDMFHNDSLAVKKFLELRKNNDAEDVLKKIKDDKFERKEWQEKKQQEQESLKKLVDEIKKKNVSFSVLSVRGKLMKEEPK